MGTGVYKWPMILAADIAVKALLTSTFEETLMCVLDEKTRLIYQAALDRHL
jgi:O-acetyl-ADP-ribose deacetylase (regulator of RNase III)